jgi:hypothetical protein
MIRSTRVRTLFGVCESSSISHLRCSGFRRLFATTPTASTTSAPSSSSSGVRYVNYAALLDIKEIPHCLPNEPPIRVWLCTRPEHITKWITTNKIFETKPTLGLDCEWKPYGHSKIATLQVATPTSAMIAFMHKFREFPPELRDMLLSNEINKVGLEVEGDLKRLRTEYGLQYGVFVDVGRAVKRIFDAKVNGLARVGKYILNVDLPKPRHVTMSNWERYPLTMEQIRYAAHDALIGACIFDQMKTMAPIAMTFFDVCEEKYRLYNLYVEEDNEHMSTRFVKEMQKTKNVTPPATSAQALFEQALASGVSSDNTFNPLTDNVSLGSSTALPASDNVNNEQPDRILGLLDRNAIKNKCFQIIKESSWGQHRFSELLYNSDIAWISKNSECLLQPIASVDGISGWRWSQVTYVWTCKLTHVLVN